MNSIYYKGYEIQAIPHQLAESSQWTVDILIVRSTGAELKHRKFGAGNTYKIEKEAVQHCFNFGQQIIDGEVESCSIADL